MTIPGAFINVMLMIDEAIYSAIGSVYELLMEIANVEIFTSEQISMFSQRIYALIGIFMLFKLTFSLITYIVNPDEMADKTKGLGSLGKNVIIALGLTVLVPYIFAEAMNLQGIILREGTIENLVFGAQQNQHIVATKSRGKNMIPYILFTQFVEPNDAVVSKCSELYAKDENGNYAHHNVEGEENIFEFELNKECMDELSTAFGDKNSAAFNNYKRGLETQQMVYLTKSNIYTTNRKGDDSDVFIIKYHVILSTVVGVIVLLILITFCMDIALRAIKLGFFQIIAPIPIISYCDPKSGKDGMFKKWVKACVSTYLDLFIRLAALWLAVYIILEALGDLKLRGWVAVFIIIGALMFAKQLPKIITDITGIKMDSKFTLNPFKKLNDDSLGGKAIMGAAGGAVAGFLGQRGAAKFGGIFSGALRGGATNKGFMAGMDKQADINRKMRDARIRGAGFFSSRMAGITSAVGADGWSLEKEATDLRKNKRAVELTRRDVDSKNKVHEVAKKGIERKIAPKEAVIAKKKAVSDNIDAMEKKVISFIESGKAGDYSNTYKKLQGQWSSVQNLKAGDALPCDIYGTDGKLKYKAGTHKVYNAQTKTYEDKATVLTPEMLGEIQNMPIKYAKKEGRNGLMQELLNTDVGKDSSSGVGAADVNEFKTIQHTYETSVGVANEVIRQYNNGDLSEDHKALVGDERTDEFTVLHDFDSMHNQMGDNNNEVSRLNDTILEDKAQIEGLDRQIKANITDSKVTIKGKEYSIEEAERIIKEDEQVLKDKQDQLKVDTEMAGFRRPFK